MAGMTLEARNSGKEPPRVLGSSFSLSDGKKPEPKPAARPGVGVDLMVEYAGRGRFHSF